ncbi:gamma-crystallin S-like [Lethenteron reissneri]|uniref:gamma-crystallin S-like n=1 Tax=Lethenteron reissneri TaxID=7753 RepID=UPI002AB6AA1C|nr:gamma-crystallin S-like [Lethenteron reissneri]
MGKIIFYEERNFQGRRYECSQETTNTSPFLSRCNSIRVESGAWVVFERADFKGYMYILEPGEYADYQRWAGFNERLGSCRTVREADRPQQQRLALYESEDFGGQLMELADDCPCLLERFRRREVRSVRVLDGAWVAHEEPHYKGRQYLLEKGDYRKCSEWGASSPTVQSVRCIKKH